VATRETAETVVVGAGIAGLAAAWELRDRDVVVLEASDRVGGRLLSLPRGRYWLNFGAHVFAGADSETERLVRAVGVHARDVPGVLTGLALNGRLHTGRRVEVYPFAARLPPRDRLALIRAGARLRLAVMRYARATRPRPGESAAARRRRVFAFEDGRTFADFLGRVPADVDAVFRATINRSSCDPEQVAAGYGIGYFQLVWDRRGGLTRNVVGGSARLPEAIAAALGDRVRTGSEVLSVAQHSDGVTVRYRVGGDEAELRARAAIVATPAYVTARIVAGLPADTAGALGAIHYGPYLLGSFLTDEPGAMAYDGVYAVATPKRSFNMLFNTVNVLRGAGPREPGGSLMVYSGGTLAEALWELPDAEVERRYVDDLCDLYPALRGHIAEAHVHRWTHGLPHPHPGRARLQPALERPLGRLHLAGDYLGTSYTETSVETGTAAGRAARTVPA
jgi:oxygen-dependent protoporphyrinogen oxidase